MTATAKAHTFLRQARRDFPDKSATWRHLMVCNALNELGIRAQLFLRCMDVAPEDDGPDTALTVAAINLPDEPLIDEHRRRGEVSIFRGHLERNGMAHRDWELNSTSPQQLFWGLVTQQGLDVPGAREQGGAMAAQWKFQQLEQQLGTAGAGTKKPRF